MALEKDFLFLINSIMNTNFESINRILADWNPIGVSEEIALDEYKGYIPTLMQNIENKNDLMNYLESILINKMEVGYDPKNKDHSDDLQSVCSKLLQVYHKTKNLD